jgi:hypothetical protein
VAFASGSRSASQPVGLPTASTSVRPMPGFISSPALRTESPASSASSSAQTNTAVTDWRALKRVSPSRSKRFM